MQGVEKGVTETINEASGNSNHIYLFSNTSLKKVA